MVFLKKFDVFNATTEEWNRFNEVRRSINAEQNFNEIPVSDEYFKNSLQENYRKKDIQKCNFNIYNNDILIGYAYYDYFDKSSPSYKENEKIVNFDLRILQKYFRSEIALQALELIVKNCSKIGKTIFITETESKISNSFNESIGMKKTQVFINSKLNIDKIPDDLLHKWISEGKSFNPTALVKIFEDRIPEEYVNEFSIAYTDAGNDQPRGETELGDEVINVNAIREQEIIAKKIGAKIITCCTIETDGQISSITQIKIIPGQEKEIKQKFTGVPQRYRGRKLGKLVKATMILYLKEHYPEAKEILTGNADSNESMLYINKNLGFNKYKEITVFQITLSEINKILFIPSKDHLIKSQV